MTIRTLSTLAGNESKSGDFAAAEQMMRTVHAAYTQSLGEEHPNTVKVYSDLVQQIVRQGRFEEAASLLDEVIDFEDRVYPPGHWLRSQSILLRGECRLEFGEFGAAERDLTSALCILEAVFGAGDAPTERAVLLLGDLYARQGRDADAAALEAAITEGTVGELLCRD